MVNKTTYTYILRIPGQLLNRLINSTIWGQIHIVCLVIFLIEKTVITLVIFPSKYMHNSNWRTSLKKKIHLWSSKMPKSRQTKCKEVFWINKYKSVESNLWYWTGPQTRKNSYKGHWKNGWNLNREWHILQYTIFWF